MDEILLAILQATAVSITAAIGLLGATKEKSDRAIRRTRLLLLLSLIIGLSSQAVTFYLAQQRSDDLTRQRNDAAQRAKLSEDKLLHLMESVSTIEADVSIRLPIESPALAEYKLKLHRYFKRKFGSEVPNSDIDLSRDEFLRLPLGRDWSNIAEDLFRGYVIRIYPSGATPPECPTTQLAPLELHFAFNGPESYVNFYRDEITIHARATKPDVDTQLRHRISIEDFVNTTIIGSTSVAVRFVGDVFDGPKEVTPGGLRVLENFTLKFDQNRAISMRRFTEYTDNCTHVRFVRFRLD